MSHRREAKQQRRVAIMEKRRKTDQVSAQMIQERIERRLAIIEDMKQKIAMIEEHESDSTVDATEEEVSVNEVEVV